MFAPSDDVLLYTLTDQPPLVYSAVGLSIMKETFDRPDVTIRAEAADATRLSRYYGSFDAVFMRNFLGDIRIAEDDKCEAIEESLLCLRTPKTLGASALWAVETYTPLVAERLVARIADAFPILHIEHAEISAEQARDDPRFSDSNYPIHLTAGSPGHDIYKISHIPNASSATHIPHSSTRRRATA